MSEILENQANEFDTAGKVLNALVKIYRETGDHGGIFRVTAQDYAALLKEKILSDYDPAPQPPIKRESSSVGLFYRKIEVEYDHHAPEYLEKRKAWQIRQDHKYQAPMELVFMGPKRRVKVEIWP